MASQIIFFAIHSHITSAFLHSNATRTGNKPFASVIGERAIHSRNFLAVLNGLNGDRLKF